MGREDLRTLTVAVRELDELSRAILALRELEGMSYEEIASTLDVSVAVVKIRLFRARSRLRERTGPAAMSNGEPQRIEVSAELEELGVSETEIDEMLEDSRRPL